MAKKQKDKLTNYIKERIKFYWESKRTYDATRRSFEEEKLDFKQEMDKYFDMLADDENKVMIDLREEIRGIKRIICQRVSQVQVVFNLKGLKSILNKKQQRQVIKKHYKVINWPGLLQLLKESGVDWKEFLKYVEVTEDVDEAALEKLVELGEVNAEEIVECTDTKIRTQYYKITEK